MPRHLLVVTQAADTLIMLWPNSLLSEQGKRCARPEREDRPLGAEARVASACRGTHTVAARKGVQFHGTL